MPTRTSKKPDTPTRVLFDCRTGQVCVSGLHSPISDLRCSHISEFDHPRRPFSALFASFEASTCRQCVLAETESRDVRHSVRSRMHPVNQSRCVLKDRWNVLGYQGEGCIHVRERGGGS